MAAEAAGEVVRAAQLYERVVSVDPTDVSAAFGLARCLAAGGDRAGGAAALDRVPRSSAAYGAAQSEVARLLAAVDHDTAPTPAELARAAATVERLQIDAAERAALTTDILERALALADTDPDALSRGSQNVTLFGRPLDRRELKRGLEAAYRERARLASDPDLRIELVDRANSIRPRTLF